MEKNNRALPRPTWRSLTFQLFLFVIIPLVAVLLLITFGSVALHEKAMRDLVGERDERMAQMAAQAINDQVRNQVDFLSALAIEDPAVPPAENLDPMRVFFDGGIAWLDEQGGLISRTSDANLWNEIPVSIGEGLEVLRQDTGKDYYISPVEGLPGSDQAWVAILAAAPDRGKYVVGMFSASEMAQRSLSGLSKPGLHSTVWLVDNRGTVVYQVGSFVHSEHILHHPGVQAAFQGRSGREFLDVEGMEHVLAYAPVPETGWALLVEEPWEHVASPQLQLTQMAPLVMVPVALLALVGLIFGIRQVVQPLQSLARQSERLGWGEFAAIEQPVGGIDEIRRLQGELISMARKVQSAQDSLHSYIGAITAGQEDERRRLARELHDETIQSLIALKQRLQLTQMDWADQPAVKTLPDLEEEVEQAIGEVRRMVRALRPIYLEDLGLAPALSMLANETGQTIGIRIDFVQRGVERRLDGAVELSLYRIAQEGLNNILRHAGARNASLQIDYAGDRTILTVQDDGKGFELPKSPSDFAANGHFGLLGMQERAELIKGRLVIKTSPGKGTTIRVEVPSG